MSEQPMAYEEVPGTRTLQQAVEQPQRVRWAYEELQTGDVIEAGDQWQNSDGRWQALVLIPGAFAQVRDSIRARRPHNITRLQAERDKTRAEVIQLRAERQEYTAKFEAEVTAAALVVDELTAAKEALKSTQRARDELQLQVEVLAEVRTDEKRLHDDLDRLRGEYLKVLVERDEARVAIKSTQRARDELQRQVDELRAGLMGVVSAEHVHSMLEDMLDQTEWVGQCLDSSTYEQMSCIQRTIAMIAERVNDMGKEGTSADD